jgi:hypothetical protein
MMRLIFVDDDRARLWSPFAETRPVGELRYGAMLLRERVERWLGVDCSAHLVEGSSALVGFDEPGSPPVISSHEGEQPVEPGTLFWLSRAAPDLGAPRPDLPENEIALISMGGATVGIWIPADPPAAPPAHGLGPLGDPVPPGYTDHVSVAGTVLGWPWDLVDGNPDALTADLGHLFPGDRAYLPPEVHHLGDAPVSVHSSAQIGPGVILDTREGPIRLDEGVVVEGPARLTGPLHLGPGSRVFGGHLSRLSAGPVCKLRGEVDTTVLLGFVNKAHDGYLGHALVGRWVNLGALTTNSDLKNDYGPVRVQLASGTVDTGLMKVGVFLGDHVKTGIGTVLNTGTVVGAGSNVFGGGMPPKALPPFSWAGNGAVTAFRWDKFLEVAKVVLSRRDERWTPGVEAVLHRLWRSTHGEAP